MVKSVLKFNEILPETNWIPSLVSQIYEMTNFSLGNPVNLFFFSSLKGFVLIILLFISMQ